MTTDVIRQGRRTPALLWFCMALIALCGGFYWLTYRQARQVQLDTALLHAIRQPNARAVRALLAQGADPNAQEIPNVRISLWKWALDRLRGRRAPDANRPSALQVAVRADLANADAHLTSAYLDVEIPKHAPEFFAVIQSLLAAGADIREGEKAAGPSLQWAERALRKSPDRPLMTNDFPLYQVEGAFQDILGKYGPSGRAYAGLGQALLQQGGYAQAARRFRLALLCAPTNLAARAGLNDVEQRLQVSQALERQLGGKKVLRICRYPGVQGRMLWAVLYGNDSKDPTYRYTDVHLALYKQTEQNYKVAWPSDRLNDRFSKDSDLQLFVFDMTGDGVSEIVVHEIFCGASWEPSCMNIFAWQGNRLTNILEMNSSMPLWIENLNHDGKYQVRNIYEIGTQMSHAEQPRWSDIYAYENGRYRLANEKFPAQFAPWIPGLRQTLQKYPDDYSLLYHLGLAYEIRQQPKKAAQCYRKAEPLYAAELEGDEDANRPGEVEQNLKHLRAYLHAMKRKIGPPP